MITDEITKYDVYKPGFGYTFSFESQCPCVWVSVKQKKIFTASKDHIPEIKNLRNSLSCLVKAIYFKYIVTQIVICAFICRSKE